MNLHLPLPFDHPKALINFQATILFIGVSFSITCFIISHLAKNVTNLFSSLGMLILISWMLMITFVVGDHWVSKFREKGLSF